VGNKSFLIGIESDACMGVVAAWFLLSWPLLVGDRLMVVDFWLFVSVSSFLAMQIGCGCTDYVDSVLFRLLP
jgi:hypothetical protein